MPQRLCQPRAMGRLKGSQRFKPLRERIFNGNLPAVELGTAAVVRATFRSSFAFLQFVGKSILAGVFRKVMRAGDVWQRPSA